MWPSVGLRSCFDTHLLQILLTILLWNPVTPLRGSYGPSQQHVISSIHHQDWQGFMCSFKVLCTVVHPISSQHEQVSGVMSCLSKADLQITAGGGIARV